MRTIFCIVFVLCFSLSSWATGHGPVFGYATPTNSQGEWSFDFGLQERDTALGSQLAARSMFTYGFTPYLQLSLTTPAILTNTHANLPVTMMSGGDYFQSNLSWRFQHQAKSIGKRIETTGFGGLVAVGPQAGSGPTSTIARAPGFNAGAVAGLASRSHYLWLGGAYTYFIERDRSRIPSTVSYSLVYGFRPRSLRKDYPHWDWRIFGELVGERSSRVLMSGSLMSGTQAHQVFFGPSTLGIYKSFAIAGGVQFPVYRDVGSFFPRERVRVVINLSYFLFHREHSNRE